MRNWKTVYKTDKLYQAQIVKDYLQDKELQPIIVDKKDSAYQLGFLRNSSYSGRGNACD